MSATQPGTPADEDDGAESRGLGPVVKPEKETQDELWRPLKGHPGIEVDRNGKWRTVDLPKPPEPAV